MKKGARDLYAFENCKMLTGEPEHFLLCFQVPFHLWSIYVALVLEESLSILSVLFADHFACIHETFFVRLLFRTDFRSTSSSTRISFDFFFDKNFVQLLFRLALLFRLIFVSLSLSERTIRAIALRFQF